MQLLPTEDDRAVTVCTFPVLQTVYFGGTRLSVRRSTSAAAASRTIDGHEATAASASVLIIAGTAAAVVAAAAAACTPNAECSRIARRSRKRWAANALAASTARTAVTLRASRAAAAGIRVETGITLVLAGSADLASPSTAKCDLAPAAYTGSAAPSSYQNAVG